jgi:single-stranded DNA-binding protein
MTIERGSKEEVKVERIEVIGRLVRDPEVKTVGKFKTPVAQLTVAADEIYVNGQRVERTDQTKWQTAVFWRGDAAAVEQESKQGELKQGAIVRLEGKRVERPWGKEGQERVSHEIHEMSREEPVRLSVLEPAKERHPGNKIELEGVVKFDPQLQRTEGGKYVLRVPLEATEVRINGAEVDAKANQKQTAIFWEDKALELERTLKRGDKVVLKEGELVTREWDDGEGKRGAASEIHRAKLEVLERGKAQEPAKQGRQARKETELER